jgi:hypothetical protein
MAEVRAQTPVMGGTQAVDKPRTSRWGVHLGMWAGIAVLLGVTGAYHFAIATAHPDLPHRFLLVDRLFDAEVALAVLACGLLVGLRLLRLLRLEERLGRLAMLWVASGLGLGALSLLVLALGLLRLYYPVTFVVFLMAPPLVLGAERRRAAGLLSSIFETARRWRSWRGPTLLDTIAGVVSAALCACVLVLTFLRDLALPSVAWDSYQYHWAVPALLLQAHGMRGFPGWAHANLPYNTEMLNLIALGLKAPEAALIIQDVFVVLGAMLVFSLVRRHFGPTTAWLAAFASLTVPMLMLYTSLSYVEPALIFYGSAALVMLVYWLEEVIATGRVEYSLLLLAGICIGLDIGVKYTALEYVPGLALLLLIGIWMGIRSVYSLPERLTVTAQAVLVVVGAASLVFAPWALRDWLLLGNPVYPALANIFGAPLWNSVRDQTLEATFHSFGPKVGWVPHLHLYALDLFVHPGRYGEGWAAPTGQMGLAVVLAIPFLALAVRPAWRARAGIEHNQALLIGALALTGLLAFGVWTFSGALVARYALPALMLTTVLGATLVGWFITWLPSRGSSVLVGVSWLALCAALVVCGNQGVTYLINSGGQLPPQYTDISARVPGDLLKGHISENAYEEEVVYGAQFWQMADYVNHVLPHNQRLLMLGRGTGYIFTQRDYVADSGEDWVPYLVSEGKTPEGMLRLLQSQHFAYVVYDSSVLGFVITKYGNTVLASYLPAYLQFQQSRLTLLGQWGSLSLYRVPGVAGTNDASVGVK